MQRFVSKSPQTDTDTPRPIPGLGLLSVTAALTLLATMYMVALVGALLFKFLCLVATFDDWVISRRVALARLPTCMKRYTAIRLRHQSYSMPN